MCCKSVPWILIALLFIIIGCKRAPADRAMSVDHFEPQGYAFQGYAAGAGGGGLGATPNASPTLRRFIAERHTVEVTASESDLQKLWESVATFCGTAQCEILSSSFTTRAGNSPPYGTIVLRIAPQAATSLFTHVQKLGKITRHITEREDKTTAVVDTDAKIKNLTSFRDSLRAMLAKSSMTVKDLMEIQQQLTETQSQLDGETAQRKILANETEKTAVVFSFTIEKLTRNESGLGQIGRALGTSGAVLGESTASLITFVETVIPWLILIVPGIWLLRRGWRSLRRKRTFAQQASAPLEPRS